MWRTIVLRTSLKRSTAPACKLFAVVGFSNTVQVRGVEKIIGSGGPVGYLLQFRRIKMTQTSRAICVNVLSDQSITHNEFQNWLILGCANWPRGEILYIFRQMRFSVNWSWLRIVDSTGLEESLNQLSRWLRFDYSSYCSWKLICNMATSSDLHITWPIRENLSYFQSISTHPFRGRIKW